MMACRSNRTSQNRVDEVLFWWSPVYTHFIALLLIRVHLSVIAYIKLFLSKEWMVFVMLGMSSDF